jgi:hypothetical protein
MQATVYEHQGAGDLSQFIRLLARREFVGLRGPSLLPSGPVPQMASAARAGVVLHSIHTARRSAALLFDHPDRES